MKRIWTCATVMLTMCGVAAVTGCGQAASTPKAAIENMVNAAKAGDAEAFAACVDAATPDQKKMVDGIGEVLAAMKALDKAASKKFGEDAWLKAKNQGGDPSVATPQFENIDLTKVTVKEEGDKATATMEGETKPIHLVRKGGSWKLVLDEMPEGEELEAALKMMKVMADAHKKALAEMDKAQSPEDVGKVIAAEVMKAMMGDMPMPLPE
jgi:hypothetical protein